MIAIQNQYIQSYGLQIWQARSQEQSEDDPLKIFRIFWTCLPNLKSVALNVLVLDSSYQLQHKIDGPKFVDPSVAAVSP